MNPLQKILTLLQEAPESQLSSDLREQAKKCNINNREEIFKLFEYIFSCCDCERSEFVAELVNPKFTRHYYEMEDSMEKI